MCAESRIQKGGLLISRGLIRLSFSSPGPPHIPALFLFFPLLPAFITLLLEVKCFTISLFSLSHGIIFAYLSHQINH